MRMVRGCCWYLSVWGWVGSGGLCWSCVGGGERNIVDASGWASAGADPLLVNSCREGSSPRGFDVFFKCLFLVFFLQRRFSFRLMCFYPAQRSAESYLTLWTMNSGEGEIFLLSWGALSHRSSHDSGHWSWWSFWSLHFGWLWWLAKAMRKFWGASGDFELLRGWPCTCWYITCTSSCLMAPVCRTYGLRSATLLLANWWQSCVGCVDFSQCRSNYGLACITVEYFPAVFYHICLANQQ